MRSFTTVLLTTILACGAAPATASAPLSTQIPGPADLPEASFTAKPRERSLAAFAKTHHKTVKELKRAGYRAVADAAFTLGAPSNGLAVAARMASTGAARKEARRLFKANSTPDRGVRVSRLAVPGVATAEAVVLTGKQDGVTFRGVEVVWRTAKVVHEVFAIGRRSRVDPAAIVRAVQAVHARSRS